MTFTSLYIHIPFCVHRCGYCDFNTYAGLQGLIPKYAQSISTEISYLANSLPEQVSLSTVYFGGGTPSLLQPQAVKLILSTIKDSFSISPLPEITFEANPGTVSQAYFQELRDLGVNRLSLGMQSAHSHELALLERQHSFDDVVNAVTWAQQAGLSNINLDLIYGLPGQSLGDWQASLEAALSFQPEHLSLYALALEQGTPLQHKVASRNLPEPDPDLAADMYEYASNKLSLVGFTQYEISNWARAGQGGELYACQHNLQYWRTLPYLGIGAGAHGFVDHYRTVNVLAPRSYINRLDEMKFSAKAHKYPGTPATTQMHYIDPQTEIGEMMMMGLRLVQEGVSKHDFYARYQVYLQDKFDAQIRRLISLDLLEWSGPGLDRLRLTRRGCLLGNHVFREFI